MTVLILSEEYDPSVDRVVATLTGRGIPVFRVDLGWFPQKLTIDAELRGNEWAGFLRTPHREVRLTDLRSVWCRNPTVFAFPDDLSRARRQHAEREARLGVGGVLSSLPITWMNHPQRDADNAYKPHQLALAARCGLTVPRTLITNEADAVRRFARSTPHGLVTKVLGANIIHEDGLRKFAPTTRIHNLADLTGIDHTAHQFQEWVPKAHEVRLIAVGTTQFAVGIHTDDPEAHIDWRTNYEALDHDVVPVPHEIADQVRAFMALAGLMFSALDFVVTPGGDWVFLESNSVGQYGWLTPTLGTAVSDAISDHLGAPR